MTPKPGSVSTLVYHWSNYTGTTLGAAISQWCPSGNPVILCIIGRHWETTGATSTLGCHWTDYTGTTLADGKTQWCLSGNPVLIHIIGAHWKTTGMPLEDHGSTLETHWLLTVLTPVEFQCTPGTKIHAHWITTES